MSPADSHPDESLSSSSSHSAAQGQDLSSCLIETSLKFTYSSIQCLVPRSFIADILKCETGHTSLRLLLKNDKILKVLSRRQRISHASKPKHILFFKIKCKICRFYYVHCQMCTISFELATSCKANLFQFLKEL